MAQISKRSYDEVAAAIRKMKDCVIADPATSHLLIAVITMQKEISRTFSENNSAFRPDMFATACEPLFRPGRMGKQPPPERTVTNGSEKSPATQYALDAGQRVHEELAASADAAQQPPQQQVALLATARYGDSSKPQRRTIGRADLYGRDRRKQKSDRGGVLHNYNNHCFKKVEYEWSLRKCHTVVFMPKMAQFLRVSITAARRARG